MLVGTGFKNVNIWDDIRTQFERDAHIMRNAFRMAAESTSCAAEVELAHAEEALNQCRLTGYCSERFESEYEEIIGDHIQSTQVLAWMALVALNMQFENARNAFVHYERLLKKRLLNGFSLPDSEQGPRWATLKCMSTARNQIVHKNGEIPQPPQAVLTEGEEAKQSPEDQDGFAQKCPEYVSSDGRTVQVTEEGLDQNVCAAVEFITWLAVEARKLELASSPKP